MDNLFFLIEIIITIVETYAIFFMLKSILGLDKKKVIFAIFIFATSILVTSVQKYIDINLSIDIFNGIVLYQTRWISMIYFVIATILVFNDSISKKIMWGLLPTLVIAASDFIAVTIMTGITGLPINELSAYSQNRIFTSIIYLLFSCMVYFLLIVISNKLTNDIYLPFHIRLLLIICIVIGIIAVDQLIDISIYPTSIDNQQFSNKAFFICISFFIIVLNMFVFVAMLGKVLSENAAYVLATERTNLEKKHYLEMEQSYDSIREIKHDMRNNVRIMQGLIAKNDIEGLSRHFESIIGVYTTADRIFTNIIPLNVLIANKYKSIIENDIHPMFSIEDLDTFNSNYTDLCSIIGNLFDNAIEACCKVVDTSQRYINFALCQRKDMLVIDMVNSTDGIYLKTKNKFLSRKGGLSHGIGLRIVERNVLKYNGHCVISAENNTFKIQIALPLEKINK